MKKVKKLLAMIMAMTMVLGMAMTVSAAETTNATISINNEEGAELYYAQIVVPDPTSSDGWKYVDAYASDFASISVKELVQIVKDGQSGDAVNGTLTTSSELAAVLENIRTDVQTNGKKVENNSFPVASGGLYVVIPEKSGYTYSPTLVYVEVNKTGTITVQTKGAEDQIEKTVGEGGESVAPGDVVTYTVTAKYPFISANYVDPTFKITDTLINGTIVKDVADDSYEITVNGLGTLGVDYTVTVSDNAKTVTIDMLRYDSTKAGTDITITYQVSVDDTVVTSEGLSNKVSSELQVDPDGEMTKTEHIVITKPVKVQFSKVSADEDVTGNLPGAVFAVYKGTATDEIEDELFSIVADAAQTSDVTLPEGYNSDLLKADGTADGTITINGLDAQEQYYLVEIVAPAGYAVDDTPHQLIPGTTVTPNPTRTTSTKDGVTTVTDTYTFNDFTVTGDSISNTKLSSLPSTGGIGTTIFTIGGCAIMIAAAALYFASKKKSEEN